VPSTLHPYRFARKTAEFLLCRNCGVYIGARMVTGTKAFGIVNVRAVQSVVAQLPEAVPMDYENEALADRLARREKRWTPIAIG
jgi:hypothetical protein